MRTHSIREGMPWIELDSQDRSRAEQLVVADLVGDVAKRELESLDREPAGLIEADQRSACLHEIPQGGEPGFGETTHILRRYHACWIAVAKLLGRRRRQDDGVVALAKVAGAYLRVVDAREMKLV